MAAEIKLAGSGFLDEIKKNAGLTMLIGVMLVISGFFAIVSPLMAGLSIALVVGVLLLINGVGLLFLAFKAGSFGKGFFIFLAGILTILVGGIMFARPGAGLASMTLFLALYFLFSGISDIVWSFQLKPENGWGWTLFSGIVSLLLGGMIWRQFPVSGAWAVGVLVGIRFLTNGITLVVFGIAARGAVKELNSKV